MENQGFKKALDRLIELRNFSHDKVKEAFTSSTDNREYEIAFFSYLDAILFAESHILINSNQMVDEMQCQSDVLLEIKALLEKNNGK